MSEVPLKEHVDARLCALERSLVSRIAAVEKGLSARMQAAERAVEKAEKSVDLRLAGMNEFRQTLTDQAATFLTRSESNLWRGVIDEKIHVMQARLDKAEGRGGGMQALWGWIIAVIAVIGMVLSLMQNGG